MTSSISATNKPAGTSPGLRITYPDLPVAARRDDILAALERHRVLILCGETGSGKTTQIPKMCLEAGIPPGKLIGCTQPRRIAARSVAARIAQELGSELGGLVGYKVRFSDKVRPDTAIKVMTDGILLAESQGDPLLSRYDTIILDEAHERSLNIDFLLGYLKTLLDKRADLRVLVTSATIDAERFSKHFDDAPVIEVSGRLYPVEIRWRPIARDDEAGAPGNKREAEKPGRTYKDGPDQIAAILDATDELARLGPGDILVFLPGEREIRDTAEALRKHHPPGTEILPLFSRLSVAEQDAIFKPTSALRRIVLATNVAETSLTVPGIRYVIDPGTARVKRYSARNKVEQLLIEKVSQASANQRAGRCGRVADGVCIRLYDEADFSNRPRFTDPELLRSSLAGVILRMKSLGLGDVVGFPFIDPPSSRLVTDGYQLLGELHALDEQGQLTKIGRQLAKLPLDPRIARMLLAAEQQRCVREILIIASALSVQDPRDRPMERAQAADEKHKLFQDERSDFMGWLRLWRWYEEQVQHKKTNRQLQTLLQDHFLSPRRMREWRDIHGQLHAQVAELGLRENEKDAGYDAIHQALLSGLLGNIGFKSDDGRAKTGAGRPKPGEGNYLGARGIKLSIHPGSALAKKGPKWIMAAELTDTGRLLARTVAEVRPEWIEGAGRHLLTRMYIEPHWEKDGARVVAWERVSLYGITLVPRRKIHYGPIDPELARELFIRGALVAGDYDTRAPWFAHNRALIQEIEDLEHKARKSGVWLDEARIYGIFDARVPAGIHNGVAFEKWRAEAEAADPRTLFLRREDILGEGLGADHTLFPESMQVDGVMCALKYRFEPGHPLDGVTLRVPLYLLNRIEAPQIDWLVPGLIREKLTALLKFLPKDKRRPLIPLPDTVTAFLSSAQPGERVLTEALAAFVRKKTGADIHPDDWRGELPAHLKMNLCVVDDSGQELASGRDLGALRQQLGGAARITYGGGAADSEFERTGLLEWDFGDLPEQVKFKRGGRELTGYPALVDTGTSVDLRLIDTAEAARGETRRGVIRLLRLALAAQFKQLDKDLGRETALALKFRTLGSPETLRAHLLDAIAARALLGDDETPRDAKAFARQKERAKPRVAVVKQALLRDVAEILDLHAQVAARLAAKPQFTAVMRDETAHLAALVPSDFITATPWPRLKDLPRYLRGILKRLEKLPAAEQRDARAMAGVLTLQNKYQARRAQVRGELPAALDDFRWQLEELRVSLFAQELKTPYPVSVKRLDKVWDTLARQPLDQ
ncbi:ATP-dependent helicase HrpA [Thiobacillus denitrificans ATCC 25259]|uniref:ATP-dependent helicase HrpA n=1 Tax=Thiobacillus denitrificans (strain ATCC 25259 / T1) TaxID=292415 RepID=Q3SHC5_THIDA|nr:ATP-dependent RNA helicase HrpA [Thiobacillus denitrificans]AAZ97961.1 ATP-dependent helicase HrpA [Thiobacillus denitrificans ATCC 25259]